MYPRLSHRPCPPISMLMVAAFVGAIVLPLASTPASADGVPIRYTLERDGKVSLNVYNDAGQLVRRLHVGDDMAAGEHTASWDGLNDSGAPVAPGAYTWRLVNSPGLKAQYLTSLGTSNGYWHWPGAHEGPGNLVVHNGTVIMAANLVEGSPQYIAWDLKTGDVKWRQKPASGFAWVSDLAVGGEHLFANGYSLGNARPELLYINPHTGNWINSWSTWKKALDSFMRVRHFALGGEDDAAKQIVGVDVVEYNEQRGYGWRSVTGQGDGARQADDLLTQIEIDSGKPAIERVTVGKHVGHGSTRLRSATFVADMPTHNMYQTQVFVANPTDGIRVIHVDINGRRGQHKLTLQPGEMKRVTNKRGKQDIRVTVSNPGDTEIGWALLGVQVVSPAGRITAHGDKLIAMLPDNLIVSIDPNKGKQLDKKPFTVWHKVHERWRVRPSTDGKINDVEFLPDGRLTVLTDNALYEMSEDGKSRVLIEGLTDAAHVSADRETGGLFIVEHGDSQQIKAYDASLKLTGTFGRRGGRLQGRYEPHDFMKVDDIAGDGAGGFVIVEGHVAPRRTAHFNADGKLIREWYGGQTFFVHTWSDPKQPDHVWFDNGHGWVTEAVVDYERGDWKPYATYKLGGGEMGGPANKLDIRVQHTGYHGFHLRWHDGERYLCKAGTPTVLRVDEDNHRVVPVAHAYRIAQNRYVLKETNVPTWATTWAEVKGNTYLSMLWSDLNGDGEAQKEETRLSKKTFSGDDCWVGDDLTYYTSSGDVITPRWVNGVPVYPTPEEASKQEARVNWRDADGNFYYQYCTGHNDLHGYGWPSTMAARFSMSSVALSGSMAPR